MTQTLTMMKYFCCPQQQCNLQQVTNKLKPTANGFRIATMNYLWMEIATIIIISIISQDGAVCQQSGVTGGGEDPELPGREEAVRGPPPRAPAQVRGHDPDRPAARFCPVL